MSLRWYCIFLNWFLVLPHFMCRCNALFTLFVNHFYLLSLQVQYCCLIDHEDLIEPLSLPRPIHSTHPPRNQVHGSLASTHHRPAPWPIVARMDTEAMFLVAHSPFRRSEPPILHRRDSSKYLKEPSRVQKSASQTSGQSLDAHTPSIQILYTVKTLIRHVLVPTWNILPPFHNPRDIPWGSRDIPWGRPCLLTNCLMEK